MKSGSADGAIKPKEELQCSTDTVQLPVEDIAVPENHQLALINNLTGED